MTAFICGQSLDRGTCTYSKTHVVRLRLLVPCKTYPSSTCTCTRRVCRRGVHRSTSAAALVCFARDVPREAFRASQLAQRSERLAFNLVVMGSIPILGNFPTMYHVCFFWCSYNSTRGRGFAIAGVRAWIACVCVLCVVLSQLVLTVEAALTGRWVGEGRDGRLCPWSA